MHDLERELRQHAAALRGLARDLVGAGDADDVVQETALQALRSKPREPGPLVGWLLGIVRHVALRHRRTQVRRSRREQLVARDDVLPPDGSVDASDSLRFLTDAVLALPQPFRAAVFARYLRDLSPAAIAAETGEPVATVKTRLKRGLAMLRERLEDDARRRGADWRVGLVGAFGLERMTAGTTALVAGGMLMTTTTTKWLVGAATAGLLAAGYVWFGPTTPGPVAAVGAAELPAAPATVALDGQPVAIPLTGGGALPLAATAQRDPVPASRAASECVVRGRCVDEAGRPLAGVNADLFGWAGNDQRLAAWRKQHGEPKGVDEKAETGSDGVFTFRFVPPPPFVFALRVRGAGVATWQCMWNELVAGATEDLGDVVLVPGTLLRGRVLDAEGAPVAKVTVRIERTMRERASRGFESWTDARTGPDGSFVARWALQAGDHALGIDDHLLEQPAVQLTGAPEQQVDIRLQRVDGERSISGVVVDGDGAPVRGVTIWPSLSGPGRIISTDGEGRFRVLRRDGAPPRINLSLQADGYEVPRLDDEFAWGRHDLRFVVTKGTGLVVDVVRASDGTPVEDFVLRVVPNGRLAWGSDGLRGGAGTRHVRGRAVVTSLKSGKYQVIVEPVGEGLAISVVPIEVAATGVPPIVVRLAANSPRTVRVQREDGSPVPSAIVQLVDPLGAPLTDAVTVLPLEKWGTTTAVRAMAIATATTDAKGEVVLPTPGDRPLGLFLPGPTHVPQRVPSVQFPTEGAFVVTVRVGARLHGRLGPPAAFAEVKRLAGLTDGDADRFGWPMIQLWRVSGTGREQFPDVHHRHVVQRGGAFDLAGVPPGRWRLVVMCMRADRDGSGGSYLEEDGGFVELEDGRTTTVAVDLSALLPGELEGLVLHNGVPLANAPVHLLLPIVDHPDGQSHLTESATTDAGGHFQATLRKGRYQLSWNASRVQGSWWPVLAAEQVTVEVGRPTRQTFTLQTGQLAVQVVDAAGKPAADVVIELRDAAAKPRLTLPATDATGRATIEGEAQAFTAWVLPKRLQESKAQREFVLARAGQSDPFAEVRLPLGRVAVRVGETTRVELKLPPAWDR